MISTWKILENIEQLDQAIQDSHQKPIVFFKHSVTCGISAKAKFMLEQGWGFDEDLFDFYYLDLLSNRAISNEIANRFNVHHKSPQIIILKGGKSVKDMSHHRISASSLKNALDK
ncbi:MAG: bacillithiol system redox-active protein YtxJ [Saprospiraceae bacterium]